MYNPQHNIGHEPKFLGPKEYVDTVVVLEARVCDDVLHRLVESFHTTIAYLLKKKLITRE